MEKETQSVIAYSVDDASLLREDVARLFNAHFKETLDVLSSRFPHMQNDGSQNEVEFKGLRAKILRSGNNKLRRFEEILADYDVVKTRETVFEQRDVKTPVVTRRD